jgi:hypothetical protein
MQKHYSSNYGSNVARATQQNATSGEKLAKKNAVKKTAEGMQRRKHG